MCRKTGCCGSFSRCLLVSLNILLFIISVASLITLILIQTGVLSSGSVVDAELKEFINQIQPYLITLIVFMSILVCISIFGFSAGCCANKCVLIIYIILVALILIAHIVAFSILIANWPATIDGDAKLSDSVKNWGVILPSSITMAIEVVLIVLAAFIICSLNKNEDYTL